MMANSMHLTITTPFSVLVDEADVVSLRAEDVSGGFGILPGHVDFLTALPVSVIRWKTGKGETHYCALRGGVLTVSKGPQASIACREGLLGKDLESLSTEVEAMQALQVDDERKARTEEMRMHARAVRQLMGYLNAQNRSGEQHIGFEDSIL